MLNIAQYFGFVEYGGGKLSMMAVHTRSRLHFISLAQVVLGGFERQVGSMTELEGLVEDGDIRHITLSGEPALLLFGGIEPDILLQWDQPGASDEDKLTALFCAVLDLRYVCMLFACLPFEPEPVNVIASGFGAMMQFKWLGFMQQHLCLSTHWEYVLGGGGQVRCASRQTLKSYSRLGMSPRILEFQGAAWTCGGKPASEVLIGRDWGDENRSVSGNSLAFMLSRLMPSGAYMSPLRSAWVSMLAGASGFGSPRRAIAGPPPMMKMFSYVGVWWNLLGAAIVQHPCVMVIGLPETYGTQTLSMRPHACVDKTFDELSEATRWVLPETPDQPEGGCLLNSWFHCSHGAYHNDPAHVMRHVGDLPEEARDTIREHLGYYGNYNAYALFLLKQAMSSDVDPSWVIRLAGRYPFTD